MGGRSISLQLLFRCRSLQNDTYGGRTVSGAPVTEPAGHALQVILHKFRIPGLKLQKSERAEHVLSSVHVDPKKRIFAGLDEFFW